MTSPKTISKKSFFELDPVKQAPPQQLLNKKVVLSSGVTGGGSHLKAMNHIMLKKDLNKVPTVERDVSRGHHQPANIPVIPSSKTSSF